MDGSDVTYDFGRPTMDETMERETSLRGSAEAFIRGYVRSILSGDISVIPRSFMEDARPVWYQNGTARPSALSEVAANVKNVFRWGENGPFDGDIHTEAFVREDGVTVVFARFIEPGGLDFETAYMVVPEGEEWKIATAMVRVMDRGADGE